MTITSRTIKIIPKELPLAKDYTLVSQRKNFANEVVEVKILFAYRKTNGSDKRVRIVAARSGHFVAGLYYIPTTPKSKVVPVIAGSDLELHLSSDVMSLSLRDYWEAEFVSGNHVFNEGQTHGFNSYSFDILSTEELDAVSSSTFYYEWNARRDNFKY